MHNPSFFFQISQMFISVSPKEFISSSSHLFCFNSVGYEGNFRDLSITTRLHVQEDNIPEFYNID